MRRATLVLLAALLVGCGDDTDPCEADCLVTCAQSPTHDCEEACREACADDP